MNGVRQAFCQIVLRPGLAIAIIAMPAVGIGATAAIFSLFHQVLLDPLPVPEGWSAFARASAKMIATG